MLSYRQRRNFMVTEFNNNLKGSRLEENVKNEKGNVLEEELKLRQEKIYTQIEENIPGDDSDKNTIENKIKYSKHKNNCIYLSILIILKLVILENEDRVKYFPKKFNNWNLSS